VTDFAPLGDAPSDDAVQAAVRESSFDRQVIRKIQQVVALFGHDQNVGNLILREGRPIEYETSANGEVLILSLGALDSGPDDDHLRDPLTRGEMAALFELVSPTWKETIQDGGIDGPLRFEGMESYRANIFMWGGEPEVKEDQFRGKFGAMVRIIPPNIIPLDDQAAPSWMKVLADANYGLFLVTGPTGAGKTTTLASFVQHINETRVGHIVTVEDPIEYTFVEEKCRITQREVGTNVRSIERGVRDAMRELPVAIMVGEVRDSETLAHTVRAAVSGHYAGATRHAPNATSAIRSLVDDLPGDRSSNAVMIAETLLGVIFQVRLPSMTFGQWEFAHECINVTSNADVKSMIASMQWEELRKYVEGGGDKTQSLNASLARLVLDKKTSEEAALRRAYDRVGLKQILKRGR